MSSGRESRQHGRGTTMNRGRGAYVWSEQAKAKNTGAKHAPAVAPSLAFILSTCSIKIMCFDRSARAMWNTVLADTRSPTRTAAHLLEDDGLVYRGVPGLGLKAELGRPSADTDGRQLEKVPAQHQLDASEGPGVPLYPVNKKQKRPEQPRRRSKSARSNSSTLFFFQPPNDWGFHAILVPAETEATPEAPT